MNNPFSLLSVSIAEFDKLCGNSLTHTYPKSVKLEEHYPSCNIADKCIPDGGHIYSEDQTGIILPVNGDQKELIQMIQQHIPSFKCASRTPSTPTTPGTLTLPSPSVNDGYLSPSSPVATQTQYLYGSVLFRNKLDERVRRGAIQKSILVITTKPLFTLFTPIMRDVIERLVFCIMESYSE